jgi:hypothetical protein
VEVDLGGFIAVDLLDYVNVPPSIGMALSHDPSLIEPLTTTLGLEDLFDIIEVVLIDAHNKRKLQEKD